MTKRSKQSGSGDDGGARSLEIVTGCSIKIIRRLESSENISTRRTSLALDSQSRITWAIYVPDESRARSSRKILRTTVAKEFLEFNFKRLKMCKIVIGLFLIAF